MTGRPIPVLLFRAAWDEPAPVLAPAWRRNDKTLVLEFRAPAILAGADDDEEDDW